MILPVMSSLILPEKYTQMDSLLITGATGYIGGKLAKYFENKDREICLLVRNKEGLSPGLKKSCRVVLGDITFPETLVNAVQSVDTVIHAAGLQGHWGLTYRQLYEVNVRGTLNMVRASFENGVRRFIHLSAGGITGPLSGVPADETYNPEPRTDYEKTKWEGEKRALDLAEKEDLNLLVIRPTFTYGPGDPHKLKLFQVIKKGWFFFIGDGLSTIHPVFIEDLIMGIELGLNSSLQKTSLIIGGPKPVTKRELVFGIADALGVSRPRLKLPVVIAEFAAWCCETSARILKFTPPLTRSRVLSLSRNWGYSIEKAKRELGYQPKYDFKEGLRLTISDYQERGWP